MDKKKRKTLSGEKIVEGIGIGQLFYIDKNSTLIPHLSLRGGKEAREKEKERFNQAVTQSEEEIAQIRDKKELPQEALSILEAHRMMLVDPTLLEQVHREIDHNNINAEWAVLNVVDHMIDFLSVNGSDYYIKAKVADLEVIKDKLISSLLGEHTSSLHVKNLPDDDFIACAKNLTVSELNTISKSAHLKGIALEAPGGVSHLTVVLRALGIPAVLSVSRLIEELDYGDTIIVDGVNGEVILNPTDTIKRRFCKRKRTYDDYFSRFLEGVHDPAISKDNYEIKIGGNIEGEEEVELVSKYGGDHIGLFRTELMFLESDHIPTEDDHYNIFYEVLHRALPMNVTIRVFDFGGDKEGNIISQGSMGMRGIRFCFNFPDIFIPQLRGLIRAAKLGNLKVMLPFVSSVGEIRKFKALLKEHATEMGLLENLDKIKVGSMIELPAALFIAEMLAKEVDFFSVGTNDLIQYLMAVERKDKSLSDYFSHFHPTVLRALYNLSHIAMKHGIDISVCGEMGSDPYFALIFMGMGFTALSMSPISIPIIKKIIKSGYQSEGRELLNKALMVSTEEELREILEKEMKKRYPNIFRKIWINEVKKGG